MAIIEIESPRFTIVKQIMQVGAPGYPHGAAMEIDIVSDHTKWTKRRFRSWKGTPVSIEKRLVVKISDKALEDMLTQWRNGVINYEGWRKEMEFRHEQFVLGLEEE